MSEEAVFITQALGVIGIGSLVGELQRSHLAGTLSWGAVLINSLSGAFLAFIIAYAAYSYSQSRAFSLVLGGLLAYQDEQYLARLSRNLIKEYLQNGNGKKKE